MELVVFVGDQRERREERGNCRSQEGEEEERGGEIGHVKKVVKFRTRLRENWKWIPMGFKIVIP